MAQKRHGVSVMLDDKLHSKLVLIANANKYMLKREPLSVSEIINRAVNEYLENHKTETDESLKVISLICGGNNS